MLEERIAAFLAQRLRPALYPHRIPLDVGAWHLPGEPVPAHVALRADYEPFSVGDPWGQPWSTSWFTLRATVPKRWAGRRVEAVLDLGGGEDARPQALVRDAYGAPLRGLGAGHPDPVLVAGRAHGGDDVRLFVEASVTATAADALPLRVGRADLAVRDEAVWRLSHDIRALHRLQRSLSDDVPRAARIRDALERAMDAVDPRAVGRTASAACAVLAPELARAAEPSSRPALVVGESAPVSLGAVPLHEAVRACARDFSTLAALSDEYPGFVSVAPAVQHYAWMKQHEPHVFERLRKMVADGAWLPVGGLWAQADTELAGAESLVRQFVHGRRFLRGEFGADSDGVWLTDADGVSPALPQIARAAGAHWLLVSRRDESRSGPTFTWEGIDGTTMLTRLAGRAAGPGNDDASARSFHTLRNPDRATLERARRLADLDGPPSHTLHPAHDTGVGAGMRGALDLAPHAGAYTSQARTKRGNRMCEVLLHEAELWSATAAVRRGIPYPYDALNRIWQSVLTQQSHDVLAGAAVARARQDAEDAHHQAARRLTRIVHRALGPGGDVAAHNAAPFARREVVVLDGVVGGAAVAQGLPDGRCAVLAEAPAHGSGPVGVALDGTAPVMARRTREGHRVLDNGLVRVTIDGDGLVRSLVDPATGHDVIAPGGRGNLLELHRDEPVADPARTLALGSDRTRRDLIHAQDIELLASGPLVATVRVRRGNGRSVFTQDLTLTAGRPSLTVDTEVDWRERDTTLKQTWPLNGQASHVRCGIAFGHTVHPPGDGDERVAQRWIHVGAPTWTVGFAGDVTHGHDVVRHERCDGGTDTTLRHTLLRAPHSPDPYADRGVHRFRHTVRPGATIGDAVVDGYRLDMPLRLSDGVSSLRPLVCVDHPDVVVETVKLAEDRSGDVVIRLYEAGGSAARTTLTADFAVAEVCTTDLLEENAVPHAHDGPHIHLELRPFEIRTLRISRAEADEEPLGA
ncbi:glycoside hydrolase family 38 C-terminal domain-containing protein [Streptomyces sp. NPDC097640]|uniref:alpha-mannosidase n=1 Tax=Streptomyces sp. NPDC097640 TaxID=3157229 RepID=UPI003331AD29